MKEKRILKLRLRTQQFGLAAFFLGLALLINGLPGGRMITAMGGLTFALSRIFRAFEPIYKEPDWSRVFPELALGQTDDSNSNISNTESHEK
jgi:hypothetical protein